MNVLGIILSLVVLIGLILIKVNPIVVSLIAASCALLLNGMPVMQGLLETYQTAFGNILTNYFLVVMFSAFYGYFMEKSGCAESFARAMIKLFGKKVAPLVLPVLS